uniref:Uncharacterized protein n=1 Tax=Timema bartmani TaxID=61472 RepID=A0A7R9HYV8_9NEOP|nr:unnamed protein product [Timema bartmani]
MPRQNISSNTHHTADYSSNLVLGHEWPIFNPLSHSPRYATVQLISQAGVTTGSQSLLNVGSLVERTSVACSSGKTVMKMRWLPSTVCVLVALVQLSNGLPLEPDSSALERLSRLPQQITTNMSYQKSAVISRVSQGHAWEIVTASVYTERVWFFMNCLNNAKVETLADNDVQVSGHLEKTLDPELLLLFSHIMSVIVSEWIEWSETCK